MAHERGLRYFDFGLSPIENTGLIEFKRRWGSEEIEVPYFYFPDVRGYKKSALAGRAEAKPNLLRKVKQAILARVAARLYKHFG